jgi:hypothetical protein
VLSGGSKTLFEKYVKDPSKKFEELTVREQFAEMKGLRGFCCRRTLFNPAIILSADQYMHPDLVDQNLYFNDTGVETLASLADRSKMFAEKVTVAAPATGLAGKIEQFETKETKEQPAQQVLTTTTATVAPIVVAPAKRKGPKKITIRPGARIYKAD